MPFSVKKRSPLDIEIDRQEMDKTIVPLPFSSFIVKEFLDTSYVIQDLIIKGGINMLSGSAGVGKTFISLEMILSIAGGTRCFKRFDTDQCPILLINEEDTERSLNKRVKMMTAEEDLPIFFLLHSGIKIDDEAMMDKIIREIQEKNIGVIVLDNLTQLHSLDENKADEIKRIFFQMRLMVKAGATVIIIHHHRKKGGIPSVSTLDLGDSLRGSTVIYGSLDSHIAIERLDESVSGSASAAYLAVTQTKNKEDELCKPFKIKMMKTPEGLLSFEYCGSYEKSVSKVIKAQDDIMGILSAGPYVRHSKKEFFSLMEGTGRDSITNALKNLVNRGIIISKTRAELHDLKGNAIEKLYFIPSVADREEDPIFLNNNEE